MAYPISYTINTCSSIINTLNDICIQPQDKKQSHQYNLLLLFIVNIDIILYLKISVIYYRVENKVNCVNIKRNQEKDIVQTDSKKSIQNKRCQNLRIVSDFIPSFNGKG